MMKNIFKIKMKYTIIGVLFAVLVTSCTIDETVDPNGPSIEGTIGASKKQLDELAAGTLSTSRNGLGVEVTANGIMAREFYLFDADPRNTGDLLGKEGITLDNNSYYSTSQWTGSYRCIKNANVLLEALDNTSVITEAEKNGYRGFVKTFQAYEFMQILKSYGTIRVDVTDPDNLGEFIEFDAGIAVVRSLLDEAMNHLTGFEPRDQFLFPVLGFSDLNDSANDPDDDKRAIETEIVIEEFILFNRAVAAVAAVYAEDGSGALTALNNSYFDLNGALSMGTKHVFSQGSGDRQNPVFRVASVSAEEPNNGDQIVVHNDWINDAETGDTRVTAKTAVRPDPSTQDGLTGTHETRLYSSNIASIDIIRNEELILVYAEASILANNLTDAVTALDVIRNAAGLSNYSGAVTADALTTEMLNQRRYSLWSENHRMFDLRRYGLSDTLPIDRAGDQIFNVIPVPLAENR